MKFVAEAVSIQKFPKIIATQINIPFLIDKETTGNVRILMYLLIKPHIFYISQINVSKDMKLLRN